MNVLALVPDIGAPSCRFRLLQYKKILQREGINLIVRGLDRPTGERRAAFLLAAAADLVILHRKLLNRSDYQRLRKNCRRLIYDFDDAVIFRDSNSARRRSRARLRKFKRLVSGADGIIAGNNYLKSLARRFNSAVEVIPTPLDLSDYPPDPAPSSGRRIGWMGTSSNFVYLSLLRPALAELLNKNPEYEFQVVSDGVPDLPGVRFTAKRWSREAEVTDLCSFDVGVMPLFSDPWTRGKCALKILQYWAAFLPVVCSPVGMNRQIIRDGVSGCFADSSSQWLEKLGELLSSGQRREQLGRKGRSIVEERFSLSVTAPRLAEILGAVAS